MRVAASVEFNQPTLRQQHGMVWPKPIIYLEGKPSSVYSAGLFTNLIRVRCLFESVYREGAYFRLLHCRFQAVSRVAR